MNTIRNSFSCARRIRCIFDLFPSLVGRAGHEKAQFSGIADHR